MQALPSTSIVNAAAAAAAADELIDRREKAFVNFVAVRVMDAVNRADVELPTAPVDLKYVFQVARAMYARREFLRRILDEDPEQFLWGEG